MKTIVENLATDFNVSKKLAKEVVDALILQLGQTIVATGELRITGFGTFKTKTRAARKGRNPSTGEEIQIAESRTIGFKPSKQLKDAL